MVVKAQLNDFDYVGCPVTKAAFNSGKVNIVSINNSFIDLNYMIYLVQYDSTHGKFNGTVQAEKEKLVIDGKPISVFLEWDLTNIEWSEVGAEFIVEPTGIFTTLKKAGAHLKGGAKTVIISASSVDAPMSVMGMNQETEV